MELEAEIVPKKVRNKSDEDNLSLQVKDDKIKELCKKLPELDKLFDVHQKIGEGSFSTVFLGSLKAHKDLPQKERRWFAIKHLIPTSHPNRVEQELRCLREIGGKDHVIGVDLCLRHRDNVVFIMPYIHHKRFSDYMYDMDAEELRLYMRALLTAMQRVHSFGLIHRDIKPANFLYDRENRRYQLVDFGLSQKIVTAPERHKRNRDQLDEDTERPRAKRSALGSRPPAVRRDTNSPPLIQRAECACWGRAAVCGSCASRAGARAARAGTPGYRAPEVLLRVAVQSAAVDVWAGGALLAAVLTRRHPLLRAPSDLAALAELAALLGTDTLQKAARSVGRRVVWSTVRRGVCLRRVAAREGRGEGAPPSRACPHCVCAPCCCLTHTPAEEIREGMWWGGFPDAAFSLCSLLLEPRPSHRITAAEALKHPFITTTYNNQTQPNKLNTPYLLSYLYPNYYL